MTLKKDYFLYYLCLCSVFLKMKPLYFLIGLSLKSLLVAVFKFIVFKKKNKYTNFWTLDRYWMLHCFKLIFRLGTKEHVLRNGRSCWKQFFGIQRFWTSQMSSIQYRKTYLWSTRYLSLSLFFLLTHKVSFPESTM